MVIEFPEACLLAQQLNETVKGKRIMNVTAAQHPHKFAWYYGDPQAYHQLLHNKVVGKATSNGGFVEISAGDACILLGDGVNLRYYHEGEKLPAKHQLHIEFDDFSSLVGSVQMYGGLWAYPEGKYDNPYYHTAKAKPNPLSGDFSEAYFSQLVGQSSGTLSLKAFLATEQRIPGLGNGVLQDILFNAGFHPRKKLNTLSDADVDNLFRSVTETLAQMVVNGGRDTEQDLFGCPGGYRTILSRNTLDKPCSVCGSALKKEAYLGGSIYYCPGCQRQ